MTTRAINVQNGANTPSTTAQILIENKIDYTPKVSVIIPVYNVEKYLRQCLDSVVAQTLKEIEIICVDDGSTDSSLEILKEYAIKDPRFTIITQENLYAGIARNAGLSIAKGEYIWFIDSDDFIEQDAIELICNNNSDIILIGYRNITNNKITENKHHCLLDYPLHKNIRKNAFKAQATIWCKIYKRDFILKQNIRFDNYKVCNDVYFAYYSMIIAESITTVPHCLYNYRKDATGALSRSRGNNSETIVLAFNNIKNKLQQNNQFKAYKKYFYKRYMQHITYELKSCNNISQKIKLLKIIPLKILFKMFSKHLLSIKYKERKLKIEILGIKLKIKDKSFQSAKNFFLYPVRVREEYKQLKAELKSLKKL